MGSEYLSVSGESNTYSKRYAGTAAKSGALLTSLLCTAGILIRIPVLLVEYLNSHPA